MNVPYPVLSRGPEDPPARPGSAMDRDRPPPGRDAAWDGPTYYGRPALKPAPFEAGVVGGYVFLAGLSGASALIATVADVTLGSEAQDLVRRGRYAALLAPTIGSALLVYDLHTPERFLNMFRVAKATSPMSIGTWILVGFSGCAALTAAAQFADDRGVGPGAARTIARGASLPAAFLGAGLTTYTAALLAATSTPLWAAAPRALAVRFGASAIAYGAAFLWLGERDGGLARRLETLAAAALAVDLAADAAATAAYRAKGVAPALSGPAGTVEKVMGTGLGAALPLALYAASRLAARRPPPRLGTLAALAILAGGAAFRIGILKSGAESASRPDVSFRFMQSDNLRE
ncbi:NrfD/PsrC family molybdoenzyme membrane anchor subunit [Methylobacterium durans]|uniref:Polysulfide reductase NrfD n=1 Tax=Methylobacterium durans TaxID=2202825 RepID=A0A2U8WAH9_9HYPH|nr:NrfD/PsrC family molybdoenzyme membrane anchor subunit [Methylobacterium durans]AWN43019.1 polysulfide reductase NrfD [Methylobacterium durans]